MDQSQGMTGNFRQKTVVRILSLVVLSLIFSVLQAQQSNTLFFMHFLPESNFINPAVQNGCKLFIGLPVISSEHIHVSNSGFTAGQLLKKEPSGGYSLDAERVLGKLAPRNIFTSELYTTLLAVGLKRDDYYYTFTVTDKDNLAAVYSRDLAAFALRGNTSYEGQWLSLNGTGIFFNHVREFAVGVSKVKSNKLTVGLKAKLLFGKLNLSTGNSRIRMFTQPNTLDLLFEVNGGFKSSLPYSMEIDNQGIYRFNHRYKGSFSSFAFNRKNPGLAFDLGFIYKYSNRVTFSGSLLDLGFIWYRSNLTNYSVKGTYLYQGPAADSVLSERYLWDVFDGINANMQVHLGYHSYIYFLDPRLYLGATYKLNDRLDGNLLIYNRLLPTKLQTSVTASLTAMLLKNAEVSASWSYMNRSIYNLGIGVGYGRSPVQVYLVSDNILGFIMPMSAKNINVRFGLNLNFGCREELDLSQCGCGWLRDAETRRQRKDRLFK
jgi:hypothetical protein